MWPLLSTLGKYALWYLRKRVVIPALRFVGRAVVEIGRRMRPATLEGPGPAARAVQIGATNAASGMPLAMKAKTAWQSVALLAMLGTYVGYLGLGYWRALDLSNSVDPQKRSSAVELARDPSPSESSLRLLTGGASKESLVGVWTGTVCGRWPAVVLNLVAGSQGSLTGRYDAVIPHVDNPLVGAFVLSCSDPRVPPGFAEAFATDSLDPAGDQAIQKASFDGSILRLEVSRCSIRVPDCALSHLGPELIELEVVGYNKLAGRVLWGLDAVFDKVQ